MQLTKLTYHAHELPELLSVSRTTIGRLLRAGTLRSIKVGRRFVVPATEITRFLTPTEPTAEQE